MKKVLYALLVVIVGMTVSCDKKDDDGLFFFGGGKKKTSTNDVVNDQTATGDFKFQTLHDVSFDLQVYDESNRPLGQAIVRVSSDEGEITTSLTADNGATAFKISIGTTIDLITLVFEHPGCEPRTVEIDNIQALAEVNRSIFLELRPEQKPMPDADGDGVPDDADEFPDDPNLIGSQTGEYTIAFEDGWPGKGDADFNDMVVRLTLKEYIDNNNMISKILVTSKVLAAGAGYKNQLWIGILGKDYELIFNPKQDLNGKWNTRPKDGYVEGPVHRREIVFNAPVARDAIEAMPYDPYIKCNGNDQNQVHLSYVVSKFAGKKLDDDGFPWAVLVPADWAWPYEGTSIFSAYPEFKPWYESKGVEYRDWYLRPELSMVYKMSAGTALTAYLTRISSTISTGMVVGILSVMIVLIVGINIIRRKKAGS